MIKRSGFFLITLGLVGFLVGALWMGGAADASGVGAELYSASGGSPALALGPVLSGLAVVAGVMLVVMGIRPPRGAREPRPRANV